jgi:hypothetical protein
METQGTLPGGEQLTSGAQESLIGATLGLPPDSGRVRPRRAEWESRKRSNAPTSDRRPNPGRVKLFGRIILHWPDEIAWDGYWT